MLTKRTLTDFPIESGMFILAVSGLSVLWGILTCNQKKKKNSQLSIYIKQVHYMEFIQRNFFKMTALKDTKLW